VLNNDLLFINVLGKVAQNLDLKFKRWEVVPTNEERPSPRKDHSFNVINRRGIAILAGGIDQYGGWLDDVWLLDLVRLHWTRVTTIPKIEETLGYLFIYRELYRDTAHARWAVQSTSTTATLRRSGRRHSGC
jgi:hypothetical protein